MKTFKAQGFIHVLLGVLLVVAIAGIGSLVYMRSKQSPQMPASIQSVRRASVIAAAVASPSVDSKGAPVSPVRLFKSSEAVIHVVGTLHNVKAGTRIEYVRYLNNKFVDNGSLKVAQPGEHYVDFSFPLKSGQARPVGKYRVKLYSGGLYERTVVYEVQ